MADCPPNPLVARGSAFMGLSTGQAKIAQLSLLANWLTAINPGADVTPSGIMRRATPFMGLSQGQSRMLTLQLLCELAA